MKKLCRKNKYFESEKKTLSKNENKKKNELDKKRRSKDRKNEIKKLK